MDICSYPQLFAACHVLLRLLMPSHSPYALISLTLFIRFSNYFKNQRFSYLTLFCSLKLKFPFSGKTFLLICSLVFFVFHLGLICTFRYSSLLLSIIVCIVQFSRYNFLNKTFLSSSLLTSVSIGGDEEDRTPDPLLARQVLSQLSYTPIFLPSTLF